MSTHELTALRPTHPVAWLAALGCLRTVVQVADASARLSWTDQPTPSARLHSTLTREALLEALAGEWQQQATQRAPLVLDHDGDALGLPPAERLETLQTPDPGRNDPAKITIGEYPKWAQMARSQESEKRGTEAVAWLRSIGTDLREGDERHPPIITMTRFYLLSRQQTLSQQFQSMYPDDSDFPYRAHIETAFHAWARVPFGLGMNWDLDGNQNAAESPDGSAHQVVVPGAIWLAMMALPLFPVGGSAIAPTTRSWVEPRRGRRGRPHLVLATWEPALDVAAVEVLLDHPWLAVDVSGDAPRLVVGRERLGQLGVTSVYACPQVGREVGGQREYFLGKAEQVVPVAGGGPRNTAREVAISAH